MATKKIAKNAAAKKTAAKTSPKKSSAKAAAPHITVYSTTQCPYCHMAKEYLKSKGFSYEDINVGEDAEKAAEMIEKSGQRGVPVIDINGRIIIGFDKAAINEALGIKG
jgi:glutaredoxin 3